MLLKIRRELFDKKKPLPNIERDFKNPQLIGKLHWEGNQQYRIIAKQEPEVFKNRDLKTRYGYVLKPTEYYY